MIPRKSPERTRTGSQEAEMNLLIGANRLLRWDGRPRARTLLLRVSVGGPCSCILTTTGL